jgi:methyl-accepting chemotaxis protein
MVIKSVTASALQGIERGFRGVRRNAAEFASARQLKGTASKDVTRSMVELHQNSHYTKASANVLKAAGEKLGTLLDIKA